MHSQSVVAAFMNASIVDGWKTPAGLFVSRRGGRRTVNLEATQEHQLLAQFLPCAGMKGTLGDRLERGKSPRPLPGGES